MLNLTLAKVNDHSRSLSRNDGTTDIDIASSFSGTHALEHYLLCLQLVLRKQVRWLIDVQKLPEELEVRFRCSLLYAS